MAVVKLDWNPVIHILDELSDGTHSFLELSYMASKYEREAFLESLLFLCERELVELSEGLTHLLPVPKGDWQRRLREAFGADPKDPSLMSQGSLDLSEKGEQVLRLLNVGHPPLSSSANGS